MATDARLSYHRLEPAARRVLLRRLGDAPAASAGPTPPLGGQDAG